MLPNSQSGHKQSLEKQVMNMQLHYEINVSTNFKNRQTNLVVLAQTVKFKQELSQGRNIIVPLFLTCAML